MDFIRENPKEDTSATRFEVIEQVTPEIEAMAGDAGTGLSKGGMKTKILAAKTATAGGADMIITLGSRLSPLKKNRGWVSRSPGFTAESDPQLARKRWDCRHEASRRGSSGCRGR